MITIESLKKAGFFSKIDELKKMAQAIGISQIYIAPSLSSLGLEPEKLNLMLDTGDCSLEDRFDFEDQVEKMYRSEFKIRFSSLVAIQESISAKDPLTPWLKPFLEGAIPIENLKEDQSLENQWGRQLEIVSGKSEIESSISSKPTQLTNSIEPLTLKGIEIKKDCELLQQPHKESSVIDETLIREKPSEPILTGFKESGKKSSKKRKSSDDQEEVQVSMQKTNGAKPLAPSSPKLKIV